LLPVMTATLPARRPTVRPPSVVRVGARAVRVLGGAWGRDPGDVANLPRAVDNNQTLVSAYGVSMTAKRAGDIEVLVVDDHRTFGEAVGVALRMEKGFSVRVATSGRDALALASAEHADVVLMDLKMPQMGGVEPIR